jgi:hypothetical protein
MSLLRARTVHSFLRLFGIVVLVMTVFGGAQPAQAQGTVIMNPDGGTNQEDGIKIEVDDVRHRITRNGLNQVYETGGNPYVNWIVTIDTETFADTTVEALYPAGATDWMSASVEELPQPDDDTWVSLRQLSAEMLGGRILTVTITTTYTTPNPYIDVDVSVAISGDTPTAPVNFYFATDLSLDGLDDGPGFVNDDDGVVTFGQYFETPSPGAVSAIRELESSPMTSYFAGHYECAFDSEPTRSPAEFANCSEYGPGEVDSSSFPVPSEWTDAQDAGAAAHWQWPSFTGTRSVSFQLLYTSYDAFNTPEEEPTPEPTPEPTAEPVTEPQQCELLPDMAVSPELIELTAGGTAEIEVALRNLCKDKPFNYSDVLLSLSDGIVVTDVPAGWLNLGQRAAWQNLSLDPDETVRAVITVSAPNGVPAGPTHVTELYAMGRVQQRTDGVFITPAPAPAAVEAPAVVEAPAAPATPAPLPTALPNTAGPLLPLGVLALSGLALAALGALGRRRS